MKQQNKRRSIVAIQQENESATACKRRECNRLIKEVRAIYIYENAEQRKPVTVNVVNKSVTVSHPDYEKISMDHRRKVALLVTRYSFYIQWKLFDIT